MEPSDIKRLEKIESRIIHRYGSTGTWKAICLAVEQKLPIVCYPIRSFSSSKSEKNVFDNGLQLKPGNISFCSQISEIY